MQGCHRSGKSGKIQLKKKFVGKVRENGFKVCKNSYFDKYFKTFLWFAASIDTDTGIHKRFSELGKGGPQKEMIEFGQEKSGKSQEISRVRSCDNPR